MERLRKYGHNIVEWSTRIGVGTFISFPQVRLVRTVQIEKHFHYLRKKFCFNP